MSARRKTKPQPLADYEVGYGKPPAKHRFRKGQSGNPRGRPRGQSAPLGRRDLLEAFSQAAREPIRVTKDGKAFQTTRIEALAQQLTVKALSGVMRAAKLLFDTFKILAPANEPSHLTHEECVELLDNPPFLHPGIQVSFVSPGETDEETEAK